MLIKLLVVIFISTSLGGCFSSSPKSRVIIVEKSINQYNINQTRLSNEVIPNKQTETTTTKNKVSKKSWSIPVAGKVLKTFSKKHPGLTFNTKPGQTVRAIRDGTVIYSGDKIVIKHPLGFYSTYAQNQSLKVRSGDNVTKGQVIALTSKNEFYFEMKKFETLINPLKYLK
ncbi:MAG: M23 family metallopeptidase [Candidatus Thioglobus sp.]|jgi:Membrane-bound metallopeptidase